MKILFYYRNRESLGIEYLSAILKSAGHSVELIFDPGLDNTFHFRNRLFKKFQNEDSLLEKAERFSPDLVALSSTTNLYPIVAKIANKLKKRLNVPIIVGGIHPTSIPEYVISNPDIDMICRGEGEFALLELVNKMSEGKDFYNTRNIWFKKINGIIIRNELRPLIKDLDSLPFPDKELFFQYGCGRDVMLVMSSRGCLFNCSYCLNHFCRKLYEGKGAYFRRRSVKNLISELKIYNEKYKVKEIAFEDDLFTTDKGWLEEFSYSYAKEIGLPFFCNSFPTILDDDIVRLLKLAGCNHLYMGIDSTNEKMRKETLKRYTSQSDIHRSIGFAKKYNVPIDVSIIFGWPGQDSADMFNCVRFINELKPSMVRAFVLYPYPQTEIFGRCRDLGLIDDDIALRIFEGEGSDVGESILNHPYKDLAYVISKLLPIYVKVPFLFKILLKELMHPRMRWFVNTIFVFMIPYLYPQFGWSRIKELLTMIIMSRKVYKRRF